MGPRTQISNEQETQAQAGVGEMSERDWARRTRRNEWAQEQIPNEHQTRAHAGIEEMCYW